MTASPDTIAVLCSGGITSLGLLEELAKKFKQIVPVYVVCGFIWEPAERFWLRRFHRQMKKRHNSVGDIIDISLPIKTIYRRGYWATDGGEVPGLYASESAIELPGRNTLLLSTSAVFCQTHGVSDLAIGTVSTSKAADAKPNFLKTFEDLAKIGLHTKVKIQTPLANMKKGGIIKKFDDLPWDATFSCINPQGHNHCGNCFKCGERQRVFEESGAKDPTRYGSGK